MRRNFKTVLSVVAILAVWLLAVGNFIVRDFYPSRRLELTSGKPNRLFAIALDSPDGCLLVQAGDWPHTFAKPFTLGVLSWPGENSWVEFYWSNDGSIVAALARDDHDASSSYVAAYDYKNHIPIELSSMAWDKKSCNDRIAILMATGGGRRNESVEVPSLNTGLYENRGSIVAPDASARLPDSPACSGIQLTWALLITKERWL